MAKIPHAESYPEDPSHPAIAERRAQVEEDRAYEACRTHLPGKPLDEVLGPERFDELFGSN